MKIFILFFVLLFGFFNIHATTIDDLYPITDVTVFRNGAMITRTLNTDLLQGFQTIEVKSLPVSLDPKSIIVEANENIDILSVNSILEPKDDIDSIQLNFHINELEKIQDSLAFYQSLSSVLTKELNLIENHDDFSDKEGSTKIEDVIKASDFYRKRIKEIHIEKLVLNKKIQNFNALITKEVDIINRINNKAKTKNYVLKIKVNIKNSGSDLFVKYFIPDAYWYPYYDLKVNDMSSEVILYRKAFVSQSSESDWKNIKLTLSTANPKQSNNIPVLNSWNLNYSSPIMHNSSNAFGIIKDEEGLPIIGANIVVMDSAHGTVSGIDGNFKLVNGANRFVEISYVGYKSQILKLNDGLNNIVLSQDDLALDEVVVLGYGSSLDGVGTTAGVRVDHKSKLDKLEQQEIIKKEGRKAITNMKWKSINSSEYKISNPTNVDSNESETDVLLQIDSIPCDFEHIAIPLKTESVYLQMKINEWYKLDILSGKANLFVENVFKGSTNLNPNSTQDTLSISLGKDPDVIIKRNSVKEFYKKKFFKQNIEEHFAYSISVKNNKSHNINLIIKDLAPVSNHEDIKINHDDIIKPFINEESGIIEWKTQLTTGQSKEFLNKYKVKYPKEFDINL